MLLKKNASIFIFFNEERNIYTEEAVKELKDHLIKLGFRVDMIQKPEMISDKPTLIIGHKHYASDFVEKRIGFIEPRKVFVLSKNKNEIIISGGDKVSILFAVYEFLERFAGVRWLTPELTHLPANPVLELDDINYVYTPPFKFRRMSSYNAKDVTWFLRQRLNHYLNASLEPSFANDKSSCDPRVDELFVFPRPPSRYVHNMFQLLKLGYEKEHGPVDMSTIFDRHPEYFSELTGKRIALKRTSINENTEANTGVVGQVCLTNKEAFALLIKGMLAEKELDPNAKILPFSLEDNYDHCRCDNCVKAYKRCGGIYNFIYEKTNEMAREIAAHYPDVMVETLAYHATQRPPEGISIEKNVIVRYCPIRACVYHALDESEHNTIGGLNAETPPGMSQPVRQLREWKSKGGQLGIWYYSIIMPGFAIQPNLRPLQRNYQIMRECGIESIFNEGNRWIKDSFLADLRDYLIAHLMWDPDYDQELGIREFVSLYYGHADKYVMDFIQLVHDPEMWDWENWIEADGISKWAKDTPEHSWSWFSEEPDPEFFQKPHFYVLYGHRPPLKPVFFEKAYSLFEKMESVTADNPETAKHIEVLKLSLHYSALTDLCPNNPLAQKAWPVFKKAYLDLIEGREARERKVLDKWIKLDRIPDDFTKQKTSRMTEIAAKPNCQNRVALQTEPLLASANNQV